jgi:3-hydroxyisobutyrate dehydrogenase-like beta-hydroxyacid dehydrogenase
MTETVVGVAGCGAMGLPMAERLRRTGFEVWGFDIRPPAEFGDFADRMVTDPRCFAAKVDILLSVVRDAVQTTDLLLTKQALLYREKAPGVVAICSTLSPRYLRDLAQQLPGDVGLMDAPMSGAPYRARSGELTFMLGGDPALMRRLHPLFEAMGREIHHLGPLGHGMTVKVLNNYCAAASVVATRRVLTLAETLEVDRDRLLAVMANSSGGNWFADNLHAIDWSGEGYSPHNTIGILEKDVRSVLDAVADLPEIGPSGLDAAILEALAALKPLSRT